MSLQKLLKDRFKSLLGSNHFDDKKLRSVNKLMPKGGYREGTLKIESLTKTIVAV